MSDAFVAVGAKVGHSRGYDAIRALIVIVAALTYSERNEYAINTTYNHTNTRSDAIGVFHARASECLS